MPGEHQPPGGGEGRDVGIGHEVAEQHPDDGERTLHDEHRHG
jgi:hypothetical protein